ncbi:MAG: recombinase family protein [Elusimicrobiota bacterium]
MEPKRVGIYCRVSTKDQTAENQLLDLRKYCQARGWNVVAECVDAGISGAKDDRPQLKVISGFARKREIDVLLVWRFDRFARSLPHLVNTLEELRSLGVAFVSLQEGIDTLTPQGRLVFGVIASLAEFERELIRDRIFAGLRRAKAQGKTPGPRRNHVDIGRLRREATKGLGLRSLATTFGVSKDTISRLLGRQSAAVADGAQNRLLGSVEATS